MARQSRNIGVNASEDSKAKPGRGRPLAFDRTRAIDAAMRLFWDRGYEGTSFAELIEAMGISASTFYNSFGSKEKLFEETVQHYLARPGGSAIQGILSAPIDTREAFEQLLEATAAEYTRKDLPPGCMVSLSATQTPPDLQTVREMMVRYRAAVDYAFAERLKRGIAAGDLPPDTDAKQLAGFFATLFRGMAVQARDGKSRNYLAAVGKMAMRVWPGDADRSKTP